MKKKLLITLAMVLTLSLLLVPNVGFATASQVADEEVSLAQNAAQAFIERIANLTHPQWKDASVVAPQPYCDLEARVVCYMFGIGKDDRIMGHILVGSSLYNNALFQASETLPPSIPTSADVEYSLQNWLGTEVNDASIIKPVRLFYSGGYHGFFAMYVINSQTIAVNLFSGRACPASDLKFWLPSPEEYQDVIKQARQSTTRSSGYETLNVHLYDDYADCTDPSHGCGPASGAMIASYYESEGYGSFPDWWDDDEMDACYEDLYDTMDTGWWGTSPTDFGPGWEEYSEDCGYYNFDDYFFYTRSIDDYWDIVDYIDDESPLGGLVLSLWEQHWYAVRGYDYDTESGTYDLYCNSPSPNGDGDVLWIGFWEKSWNNMVAIER